MKTALVHFLSSIPSSITVKRSLQAMLCSVLAACAGPDVSQYEKNKPALDIVQFFSGKTEAWGTFQKRGGKVVKRFHVDITGTEQMGKFTLDEHFRYDDGTTQQRIWTLMRQPDGTWIGRAADVKGEAVGRVAGNTLNWRYTMLLPVDGKTYEVNFDDWMYLIDEHSMMNRASMSKFGIELGQVTLFFRKSN